MKFYLFNSMALGITPRGMSYGKKFYFILASPIQRHLKGSKIDPVIETKYIIDGF